MRLHPRLSTVLALLAGAQLVPSIAHATVVVPLDLNALTDGAEQVALARVEGQVARFTEDHATIYTEVTLRVLHPLKGALREDDSVVVRREGGEAEGVGMKVVGAARFTVGEEAIVFLERRGSEALWTVGMAQGKMRLATVQGRKMVMRDHAGLAFTTESASVAAERIVPLEDVMARITERVAATAHAVRQSPSLPTQNASGAGAGGRQ